MVLLQILDYAFIGLHSLIIAFNLFGWAWRRTRRANLVLLLLTGLSWFGLGLFCGWGYCPLTDWHYAVLRSLGETGLPYSYVSYMLQRCCGLAVAPGMVDALVLLGWLSALVISVSLNGRDWWRGRQKPRVSLRGVQRRSNLQRRRSPRPSDSR